MKSLIFLLCGLTLLFFSCTNLSKSSHENRSVYNVRNHGCTGDGITLETDFIQKVVNQSSENGGGIVYFPPGTYLTGSIELFDNITLELESGAIIKGSPDMSDYKETQYVSESRSTALIYAHGASNLSIIGNGEIIGNDSAYLDFTRIHPGCCMSPEFTRHGESYSNGFPDGPVAVKGENVDASRPGSLISFINCKNILIRDVHISGSPNWCVHLACSEDIDITNVDIHNSLLVPNADAIDVSMCKRVNISDCNLIAGDDGIAISPCADGYCSGSAEDITITNCVITSRSAGIRLGWSIGSIRNVLMNNLIIHSNRGVGFFVRHDETIENVILSNSIIHTRLHTGWWGTGEPIHLSEIPLGELHGLSSEGKPHGTIRNIKFTDLIMTGESGMVLYGYHNGSLRDISFNNVRFEFKSSPLNEGFGGNFDLRPAFTDSLSLFKHNIPALYCRNVYGLSINLFTQDWEENLPDFVTNGIFAELCRDVRIERYTSNRVFEKSRAVPVQIENSENVIVEEPAFAQNVNPYVRFIKSTGTKIVR